MPKAVINLHIDLTDLETVDRKAKAQGVSRSEWIRVACQLRLEKGESATLPEGEARRRPSR